MIENELRELTDAELSEVSSGSSFIGAATTLGGANFDGGRGTSRRVSTSGSGFRGFLGRSWHFTLGLFGGEIIRDEQPLNVTVGAVRG